MIVMHEVFTHRFKDISNNSGGFSESVENGVYIIALFHRNNSGMIFFVNPDKEVSSFIMENTSSIGPVATTSRRKK